MKKFYITLILSFFMLNSWSQEYKEMISAGTYTVEEIQAEAEAYFEIVGKERGKGYTPYKRWEYNALQNMDENGLLKAPDFYFKELQDYNQYRNQNYQSSRRSDPGNWEQLGPTSWNATSGWNPGVGRVTSLAVEENNTNHIIVGGETGGVWKTIDGGVTWNALTDNLSNIYVYALTMDPTNPSTYYWGSTNGAIFKSIDSGATWSLLANVASGTVNKILIDPTSTNKMYCSVEYRGVYKSIDSGLTWSKIHANSNYGYDVEFKPGDPNVIYASGRSFFKSTDGGVTFIYVDDSVPFNQWTQEYVLSTGEWGVLNNNRDHSVSPLSGYHMAVYSGYPNNRTTRLITHTINLSGAISPQLKFSHTQPIFGTNQDELRVLYKTSIEGNWIELAHYTADIPAWQDEVIDLPNPSADYYIAFEGIAKQGNWITLDAVSIEDSTLGIVFSENFEYTTYQQFSNGSKMIGVSSDDPSVVYVLEESGGLFGAIHKSTDSGSIFTKLDHVGQNYFGYSSLADDDRGQAPRDMDIAVNPLNADDVHIAGILTWRSTDGGDNFNVTSQWTPENASTENIGYCHADVDILQFVGSDLYVGSDGGIFVAENITNVSTNYYRDLSFGLGIKQLYKIGVSQTNPVLVTAGSQDNGTSILDASGHWTDWLGADGMESFVDKNNSNILYGTSQYGYLYKSFNGGVNYIEIDSPDDKEGNWVTPFEQDPTTPNVIYTGYDQVYKSINGGISWAAVSQIFSGNLNQMKVAPSDNNYMYTSKGNSLYRNTSVGTIADWTQLTGFSGTINSIAIHPTNPNKVAIATTGAQKVYASTNGGTTWTSYKFDLPNFSALTLVWAGNASDGLYLGMNYGVYYIDNASNNSWRPFSNNLPNVQINELEINIAENKLYAGTYGRGLWRTSVFDTTLSVSEFELSGISLFPNPAKKEVNLLWNQSDDVSIRIFNSLGKLLYYSKDQSINRTFTIDISQYASGLYFVKINNVKGEITKKLIVE